MDQSRIGRPLPRGRGSPDPHFVPPPAPCRAPTNLGCFSRFSRFASRCFAKTARGPSTWIASPPTKRPACGEFRSERDDRHECQSREPLAWPASRRQPGPDLQARPRWHGGAANLARHRRPRVHDADDTELASGSPRNAPLTFTPVGSPGQRTPEPAAKVRPTAKLPRVSPFATSRPRARRIALKERPQILRWHGTCLPLPHTGRFVRPALIIRCKGAVRTAVRRRGRSLLRDERSHANSRWL
jgi:hypothetical protein